MKPKAKIAFLLYLAVILLSLVFAGMYLFRSQFMPYHAAAVGVAWTELRPEFRTLFLALLRVCGGGWLAAAIAMSILLLVPFRRNEAWSRWALPLVGLSAAVPTLYATLLVKARTPASPPWFGAAAAIVLILLGFALSFRGKTEGPARPAR
jgi:hypothetical protein